LSISDSVSAASSELQGQTITETLTITDTTTIAVAEGKGTILKFNPFTGTLQWLKDLTEIDSDVLPKLNNTYYLGNKDYRFKGFLSEAQIGDSTNYLDISDTGVLTLKGTARITKDLWIDAAGIKAPGAKPATEISQGNLENSAWQFDDQAVEANQESVSWRIAPAYDMDRSEEITIRIGWSSASTGNVKWQLEYRWLAEDEDTTLGAEETLTAVSDASTTADGLVVTDITGINAPSSIDASIIFKLTRLSADVQDTITDTVKLHGICFNYISNKLGG